MPQSVAEKSQVAIGRIFAPPLTAIPKESLQVGASKIQQRTNNFVLPFKNKSWMNSREPADSGTTQNAEQDCFRLIVERVRSRDLCYASRASQLPEEVVAEFAGGCFNSGI